MKKRALTKGMLMTALVCGFVQWGGTAVHAAELNTFALDEYVVTATRTEKRDIDIPASTEVLTQEEIKMSGATNVMEALSKVNGMEFKSYFAGGSAMTTMIPEITLRGFNNGTLVMVNGNPINLNNKYVLDAIPTEAIDRIEIVKGGGAIMYGSDAMGGVVNIITKKTTNNYITYGAGNYGQRKFNVGAGNEKFRVNYDLKKWGSIDHVSDSARPSTATSYSYNQVGNEKENIGIGYNINDRLTFEYNHFDSSVDYNCVVTQTGAERNWRDTYTKQDLFQLNYKDDSWKANMWYTENEIDYFGGDKFGVIKDSAHARTQNSSYGIDLQKNIVLSDKSLLTVGGNFKNEKNDPKIDKGNEVTDGDRERNTYAVFAQLDHKMNDKDSIILSARETWTGSSTNGLDYDNFSAAAQYVHKLNDDQNVYVSVAQSFIMPTFSQMYPSGFGAGDPNPNLKPQEGINYEIGYKAISGNHIWKAAIFHMDVKDNISASWNQTTDLWTYKNSDFRNTGIEGSLEVRASEKFGYNVALTVQNPENKTSNEPKKVGWQRKFGGYQIKSGIDYKVGKFKAALTGSYVWDRYTSPSTSDSYEVKPYFLTTLNATYCPDKNSEIALTVDNLLDRNDNLSNTMSNNGAYYATPCNFLLTYTYKF